MTSSTLLVYFIIFLALSFDFINGFHDAANSIATIVSTHVLKPQWAVVWAAVFNFLAFLFFELKVANTIGKGIVDPSVIDQYLILSALIGAIVWDLITWFYGIPSSSSHALIGALGGAAWAKAGWGALNAQGFFKVGVSIVLSPVLGLLLGAALMFLMSALFFRSAPRKIDGIFRKLQFVSAAMYSLGHGANDAQKTMGIIAVLLFSSHMLGNTFYVPLWVVICCQIAMALGTLFGGWRIVKTMGMRITKLKPVGGFCAETAGAITIFLATSLGIPVSTTHTITGGIIGVGSINNVAAVRWGVASRIVWAWILTIPASACIAASVYFLTRFIFT